MTFDSRACCWRDPLLPKEARPLFDCWNMSQEEEEVEVRAGTERGPHRIRVVKGTQGFGFNVRGQVSEGGTLKSIGGELYAPMQYISAVLESGPAEEAGLKIGDRLLEVNGQSVEGADHQSVVQLIRQSGNAVDMVVISVSEDEARRLEPETSGTSTMDYYERRSVPITVPDTQKLKDEAAKEYVVYNIYLAGKMTASRRYREFDVLNSNLKRQFGDFIFPKLPGKSLFTLSDAQVDTRRRGLEDYLDKVCSARVIFESDLMQDFLQLKQNVSTSAQPGAKVGGKEVEERQVELRVQLPDKNVTTVSIKDFWRTAEVYRALAQKIGLSDTSAKFFAIFQRMEHDFDRKVQENEFPHQIYVQKYSSGNSSESCLVLRKWLFSRTQEVLVNRDPVAMDLLYHQAVEDINKGKLHSGEKLSQLRLLKSQGKREQYLDLARSLPGYNAIQFPHCPCDARKSGHVVVTIGLESLQLRACTEDGTLESQEHTFTWDMITNYEADLEEEGFTFRYIREGKEPRWVKIFSPHYRYMEQCVDRINEEILWKQPDGVTATPHNSSSAHTAKLAPARNTADITKEQL